MASGSSTTVRVTWKDGARETSYAVERSLSATTGFAELAPRTAANVVSFNDPGRSPNTTYFYRVRAFGKKNAKSPYSAVVSIKTPAGGDTTPPTPAPALSFTNVTCKSLTVSWTASNDPESGISRYDMSRTGGSPTLDPAPVSAPGSRTDTGLTPSTQYTYTVRAYNGAGLSTAGTNTVTTPACPPPTDTTPPSPAPAVSFANVTCSSITVNWTTSSDPESGISRYELTRNGGTASVVSAPSSRTDTGLTASTNYTYTVKAVNGANLSTTGSNTMTTPACPNQSPIANAGPDRAASTGVAISFDGSASRDPDGTISSYAWNFGDSATGTGATPSHTYASAGTYTVTLTVTDNRGTTNSDTATVTITAPSGNPGDVVWSKAVGGTSSEQGDAVAVDGAGNIVLGMSGDTFLSKYSGAGAPLWSRTVSGSGLEGPHSVAVDRSANCDGAGGTNCILVTGLFSGSKTIDGTALTSAGGYDMYLAKYSASGAKLWLKQFGQNYDDIGEGVAVDAAGNVFLTGTFTNQVNFGGATLQSTYFDQDAFVAKFSPTGAHIWSKNWWSTSRDWAEGITIDAAGNVAITGLFFGSIDFQVPGKPALSAANQDIFVAKLSGADGHAVWAQRFGSSGNDEGTGIAFDRGGNVIITGTLSGSNGTFGGTTMDATFKVVAYVVKLAGDTGAHVWSNRLGENKNASEFHTTKTFGVAVDANNNVIVTGWFDGPTEISGTNVGAGPFTSRGSSDSFVVQYTAGGDVRWVKQFGGLGSDYSLNEGVTIDPTTNDAIATGGFTGAANFGGQTQNSNAGSSDAYLVRMRS